MGLKKAFLLLTLCGLLLSLLLTLLLWTVCETIAAQYPAGGFLIGPNGASPLPSPTSEQSRLLLLLNVVQMAGAVLFPVLGLSAAAALFYRWKLEKPISILSEGTARIQANDLDFSIPHVSQDELGQICAAFETMRGELLRSNRALWRQAEERRRLNAAFAHDLRNPITVLKGSVRLLRQNPAAPETLDRLESYTLRLERYVEAMSAVERLEQMPVRPAGVPWAVLRTELEETARLLAPALTVTVSGPEVGAVWLDHGLFLTVAENLIGNGSRFAQSRLEIVLALGKETLSLSVADDGPGFPTGLLESGPRPFGKTAGSDGHFGMGLYTSDLLCRKQGGGLRLENRKSGGGVATASFQIHERP